MIRMYIRMYSVCTQCAQPVYQQNKALEASHG